MRRRVKDWARQFGGRSGLRDTSLDASVEAVEAEWLQALAAYVEASDPQTRERAQSIARAALRGERLPSATSKPRLGWWLAAGSTAVALAASVAVGWLVASPRDPSDAAPIAWLAPGEALSAGDDPICVEPASGARMCVETGSTVRSPEAHTLEVVQGTATLAWTREGARPLRIRSAEIRPRGAATLVLRHASGDTTRAEVTTGTVEFLVAGTRWEARPGQAFELHTGAVIAAASEPPPVDVLATEAVAQRDVEQALAPPRDASPDHGDASPGHGDPASRRAPSTYLERARALRRQGRWQDAARTYQRLQRAYPQSNEASVSWVSLGDLQLDRLADPRGAIRSYTHYLSSGGRALDFEARHGLVLAHRKLGQAARERAAIESLLVVHPHPDPSLRLRDRLEALRR